MEMTDSVCGKTIQTFFVAAGLAFIGSADALPFSPGAAPCVPRVEELRDHQALIHKVLQVDDPDRRTVEEFAKENGFPLKQVREAVSATGKIVCPDGEASAQLTIRNNVITTTAHTFENKCGETAPVPPERCTFFSEHTRKTYRIKRVISQGYRCPDRKRPSDDWAVVLLEDNVIGVKPFAVEWDAKSAVKQQPEVLSVGYSYDFFQRNKEGQLVRPRHMGKCEVRDLRDTDRGGLLSGTNCDIASGASGGALLTSNLGNPKLLGIHKQNTETWEEESRRVAANETKETRFSVKAPMNDRELGASVHVMISGEFAESLRAVEAGEY